MHTHANRRSINYPQIIKGTALYIVEQKLNSGSVFWKKRSRTCRAVLEIRKYFFLIGIRRLVILNYGSGSMRSLN